MGKSSRAEVAKRNWSPGARDEWMSEDKSFFRLACGGIVGISSTLGATAA